MCYEVVQQNLMLSSSGSAIPRGGITQNVAGTSCLQAIVACKCPYINPACSPASGSLKNHAGGSHSSFPTPTSALLLGSGVLWGALEPARAQSSASQRLEMVPSPSLP